MQGKENRTTSIVFPSLPRLQKYNQSASKHVTKYLSPLTLNSIFSLVSSNTLSSRKAEMKRVLKNELIDRASVRMNKMKKEFSTLDISKEKDTTVYQTDALENDVKNEINLSIKKINTKEKPPHRYSKSRPYLETTMVIFKNCLLLYGGLGCERNLSWAKLSFESMKWEIAHETETIKPIDTYVPCYPIYGHTMVKYKTLAIIYGGICNDEINETTIIDTKNMAITQGSRCPLRRKEHCGIVMGDIMVIHGGIESRETKCEVGMYHIPSDKWFCASNCGLPALSGHKMALGKNNKEIYMFGGKNTKGKPVNKMYKIKSIYLENMEIKWEIVETINTPEPRHLFSFEKLNNNNLILYGGKEETESTNELLNLQNGIFNDIQIFSLEKKIWSKIAPPPSIKLGNCFGMASCTAGGAMFIFGGSNHNRYADAAIHMIWVMDEKYDPWEAMQVSDAEICSGKKVSYKNILGLL